MHRASTWALVVGVSLAAAGSCSLVTEGTDVQPTTSSAGGGGVGGDGSGGRGGDPGTGGDGGGGGPLGCIDPSWAARLADSHENEPSGGANVTPVAVATDPAGNVLVATSYKGVVHLGGGEYVGGSEERNALVMKHDGAGTLLWGKSFADPNANKEELALGVAADPSGNVLVAGVFENDIDLDGQPITFPGKPNAFAVKLDAAGTRVWGAGQPNAEARSIAAAPDGAAVWAGHITAAIEVGGIPLAYGGGRDFVVAKLNAGTGQTTWIRNYGDGGDQEANGVAVGSGGEIVVAGTFNATLIIGPTTHINPGANDAFLAWFDAAGTPVRSQQLGGVNSQSSRAVAADGAGGVVVAGVFREEITIDGDHHTAANNADELFVARFDVDGALLWSRRFGDDEEQDVRALAVDPATGHIYLTGHFFGSLDFGGPTLTNSDSGNEDLFIAILDGNGDHVFSASHGEGSGHQRANGIAPLGCGLVLAGVYEHPFDLNAAGSPLPEGEEYGSFVARIIPDLGP